MRERRNKATLISMGVLTNSVISDLVKIVELRRGLMCVDAILFNENCDSYFPGFMHTLRPIGMWGANRGSRFGPVGQNYWVVDERSLEPSYCWTLESENGRFRTGKRTSQNKMWFGWGLPRLVSTKRIRRHYFLIVSRLGSLNLGFAILKFRLCGFFQRFHDRQLANWFWNHQSFDVSIDVRRYFLCPQLSSYRRRFGGWDNSTTFLNRLSFGWLG